MKFDLGPGLNAMRVPALGLALVAVANIAVFLLLTLPAWNSSAAVGSAALVSEQAHAALEPQLQRARLVYGRIVAAEDKLAELRRRVGERSGSAADVVSTLRAAVDAAGIRAERVTYETQHIVELGLTQMQINLPVRGHYRDLRRFLDELLDGPMFVVLERVSAASPSSSDVTGELQLGLTASVFLDSAPAPQGAGAGDSAGSDAQGSGAQGADAAMLPVGDPVRQADELAARLRALPPVPLAAEEFDLRLARLDVEVPTPAASRRDLFSFAARPARPLADIARQAAEDNFVPPPVLPYDLIGVNRSSEGLSATLVDGDLVLVVHEGQILPDGYRVIAIGVMEVTLESGNVTRTISLRPHGEE